MEAVPRLPMLAFELKHSPEYVDFGPTLKKYIRDHYGEDPALYNKNFADLDQLRQNAIHVTRDFLGCATLKRYYAQLHLMNGRFPMGEGGEAAITFTWEDNQTGRDHVIADIKFEQACILYNIGALHSNLGAIDTRQNAEGMKVSCTHFQCAAWAFEHLRDHFGCSSMSTDMAHEYLTFHVNVMLAQAQECILEKSMIDSRKNTITAKVSAQVVEFYRLSIKNLNQCNSEQIINSRSYKDWKKRIELKIAFYQCITYYYMGRQSEEQQKWGERLAYFQAAQDKLNEAVKLAKNEVPEMQEALSFAQDVVVGKLQSAQKDNDFVYHEKIPPLDSLPEVKGAPLVKGIPFDPTDSEICGVDIFQKLVPMEAHEAASVYSEEKAKLLRAVTEDIETANTELEQFMMSLQIDPSIFEQVPDRLPQELLEKCAAMSVRTNAIQDLVDSMSGVSGLATEAEMNIKEIQDMIAEDAQKTEEFEKQFGKKMVSLVLPSLTKECEGHMEKHSQGSQLNATLHTAMNAHITNLRMLALPPEQLQAQLPPAQPPKSPEDEAVLTEMRRLLSKVEEMKSQRAKLEKQFRDEIQKDDITTVLMAADSTKESIFKDQLKKHDSLIGLIGQNLSAQMNILRALTDANARFAALRQAIGQQSNQRESVMKDLINSFEKYEELLAKSTKGQDYYRRLNEAVIKTLERCRSECKVRQEEREMIASKYAPKVPPPSRPTAPKPGHGTQPGTPGTPTSTTPTQPLMDPSQQLPGVVPPGAGGQAALPNFEGPKLKDFLPFMKPQSFGPKRSSPSPQSLPPGSPDPMLSGPSSLTSSASDSPQHRTLMQMPPNIPQDQQPPVGPYTPAGHHHPGLPSSAPDVASSSQLPAARPSQQPAHHAPPPDVTANLPVNPGLQPHHSSLPDVSHLPSAKDSFSALPPHMVPHSQLGSYGGAIPAASRGADAAGLSSSSESLASTGSYQQGYMPPVHPGGVLPGQHQTHMPSGSNASQNATAGPQSNVPQHPSVPQYQQPPPQQPTPPQPAPPVLPQAQQPGAAGQYPMPPGVQSHQNMVRPSPSPSPSSVPSSVSISAQQPQQGTYGQSSYTALPHLAPAASVRPGTPPQQGQPQPSQQQQPQQPYQQPQQQAYPQQQQQYYAGGAQAQQAAGQGVQPYQQAQHPQQPQQQPGMQPQARPPVQPDQQVPHPMQTYSQQVPVAGGRPPGAAQVPQQSYSQVPSSSSAAVVSSSSYGQHPYAVPSSGVQAQYSTAAAPTATMGQAPSSVSQGVSHMPGQPYSVASAYPMPAGQFQTSQSSGVPYSAQPAMQQVPGMRHHSQVDPQTVQQQFPRPHSQLPASSQPPLGPSQQPFQHNQSAMQVGQNQPQVQGQGPAQVQGPPPQGQQQLPVQGQGVAGQFSSGPGGQQSLPVTGASQVPGAFTTGGGASPVGYYPSPSTSQIYVSNVPQHPNQQPTFQPQQQVQPHMQQQRLPAAGGRQPGYSQGQGPERFSAQQFAPGQVPQITPGLAGQPQAQPPAQGQGQVTGSPRMFPGQQGYSTGPQQQQQPFTQQPFPPQQRQFPQQQQQGIPQQRQPFSQPHPSQQQFPQQGQQQQQQQQAQHPQTQNFPQYPMPQSQSQFPPESQLIFPTPLQPSRVQSADTLHPCPPAQQQGGSAAVSCHSSGTHHSLTSQGPELRQTPSSSSSSSSSGQPTHSSLPPTPIPCQSNPPASSQSGLVSGPSLMRQESSLDELLSSSPEGSKHTSIPAPIITPKVLTDQEKQQQKEEAMKKGAIVEAVKDPYGNSSVLNKFVSDVEAFGKFVDDLSITILGVSRLDTVWKSLIDSQDHDVKKQSIAIARCYPMKNRDPDIMPYDETRVILSTTKDDYINASWINDLAPSCPKFVATQAPLNVTMTDFWAMVYELGSEVIVQITSEYETSKKFPVYFPTEKGQQMEQGPMILNLQSVKYRQLWTERNVYLKHSQTKQGRTVIHLQFKMWPVSGFPDEVQHIVRFISEVHSFYHQQRSLLKPVIVHCGNGSGRTGAFLIIYTGMQEMLHGNGLIDVPALVKRMLQKRKNLIYKKEQLKFCYDALLCFAEDFLKKRNILVQHPHFEKKAKISEPEPATSSSDDIVLGSVNLHTLQQTVGRLHVHGEGEKGTPAGPDHPGQMPVTPPCKESEPISALPDLIQQQSRSDAGIGQGGGGSAAGSGMTLPCTAQGTSSAADGKTEFSSKTHSRSGSNTSQQSFASMTESGSSRASPQHGPPSSFSHSSSPSAGGAGAVLQSLADLQDPTKFTIGKGEQKKRISKASFDSKGSGAGMEIKPDPADPLSSLDAMWSIHKPEQSEK